jgi:type I restriction enzyme R subunit
MVLDSDEIILISENQTRKQLIDPLLAKMGWLNKYIKEEVNSVKSNFNEKHFVHFNVNIIEIGVDRFIDYVLLDDDFTVLAIIESKRYSLDEEKGRIQDEFWDDMTFDDVEFMVRYKYYKK